MAALWVECHDDLVVLSRRTAVEAHERATAAHAELTEALRLRDEAYAAAGYRGRWTIDPVQRRDIPGKARYRPGTFWQDAVDRQYEFTVKAAAPEILRMRVETFPVETLA
ncbi:hypothetical protein [Auraticoccus monumenti]|uniref:Uncharacterized protein n=1 Tax=Auraticoccus monumenti TaxID=675864 RepID=A0A1G7D4B9_9ACTN|nr:hypothetical protein [Auraticoccus monumenti]SDE45860.1 hypothetical protein SAMN04489747_3471 [Auraticoccus monumenti]